MEHKPPADEVRSLTQVNSFWSTTMNPRGRTLLQVKPGEAKAADSILSDLLGRDASARYRLIQEDAHRLEVDL